MGTLPDLSAMLAAQLGLASEEGPSVTVPRTGEGLSRQQKGKSVAAASAPARGPDGGCIGDLESTHHEAMMDTVDLSRSQRLLVADATRLAREGSENVAVRDATEFGHPTSPVYPEDFLKSVRAVALLRIYLGHPMSPVYAEDFLKSVRAVALLRIYSWSEITVEKICELKDRIARREWRSDFPTVLPIRTKRLNIFPKDIQKQVSEAKGMGTLPDLSAMLAAQLGLASEEGPSTTVPRTSEVPPSGARNAGKGKKRKRGGSGVERSAEEASDVPPSGEPQKKKKKKKRTEKPMCAPVIQTKRRIGSVPTSSSSPTTRLSRSLLERTIGSFGHPTSPVYPEDFLKSVRAVALLRIYRWSEITVEKIRELKDRIARNIFPKDIQKRASEAKRMGLASKEGPSTTVPRIGEKKQEERRGGERRSTFWRTPEEEDEEEEEDREAC
ncbi:hypothetical protein DY000_02054583 [Brassica cretica]|uniref:Uncharacterized protein n=1 Tax=Brassica cretica TaxID=69181 RepID=A0ABQ7AK82_BRACR|nr:hypothetical protein DY000_02054583 [Brassica cretica]